MILASTNWENTICLQVFTTHQNLLMNTIRHALWLYSKTIPECYLKENTSASVNLTINYNYTINNDASLSMRPVQCNKGVTLYLQVPQLLCLQCGNAYSHHDNVAFSQPSNIMGFGYATLGKLCAIITY